MLISHLQPERDACAQAYYWTHLARLSHMKSVGQGRELGKNELQTVVVQIQQAPCAGHACTDFLLENSHQLYFFTVVGKLGRSLMLASRSAHGDEHSACGCLEFSRVAAYIKLYGTFNFESASRCCPSHPRRAADQVSRLGPMHMPFRRPHTAVATFGTQNKWITCGLRSLSVRHVKACCHSPGVHCVGPTWALDVDTRVPGS